VIDEQGSTAWIAFPDERLQRASSAIAGTGGCLLCDPVDHPELDEALAPLGKVLAVCSLLDRHGRDAEAVAERHRAPVVAAAGVPALAAFAAVEAVTLYGARRWAEIALWLPGRELLVVPESLGTLPFFLARPDDRLGMHPLVRLRPPRVPLARLAPRTIAVGHGGPVIGGACSRARDATSRSPSRRPPARCSGIKRACGGRRRRARRPARSARARHGP
jgi:hypothetical protein